MKINYNKETIELPKDTMTVAEFIEWKEIPTKAMAFAINNRIVRKTEWNDRKFSEGDSVTVVNAAFGG